MKYQILLKNADGQPKEIRPVQHGDVVEATPGDQALVLDENGEFITPDTQKVGADLLVNLPEGELVMVQNYFVATAGGAFDEVEPKAEDIAAMLDYRIMIRDANGDVRLDRMLGDSEVIDVMPGDRIELLDGVGRPASANLLPDAHDLNVQFIGGGNLTLKDYYSGAPGGEVMLTMQTNAASAQSHASAAAAPPATSGMVAGGEMADVPETFSGGIANTPTGDEFTLMRLSNLGYANFVETYGAYGNDLRDSLRPDETPPPEGFGGPRSDNHEHDPSDIVGHAPPPDSGWSAPQPPAAPAPPQPSAPSRPAPSPTPAPNRAPVANDDAAQTPEDTPVNLNVLANDGDPDGNPISVTGAQAPNGTVEIQPDGTLTYTPNPDFTGTDTITYAISDGKGGTATGTAVVNVTPVNDPPIAQDDVATTIEEQPVTIPVLDNDSDVDGDPLIITNAGAPNGSVTIDAGGTLTYTPNPDFTGTDTITYAIDDGNGGTDTATVQVNVQGANDAPEGSDNTLVIAEDGSHAFSAADFGFNDPVEGDAFQAVTITTLPNAGSLTLGGVPVAAGQSIAVADLPNFVFAPAPNESGNGYAGFTFQVQDAGGTANGGQNLDTTPNAITFDVTPVNDAPQGTDKAINLAEDNPHTFAAADFGFSDPVEGDAFQAVTITTLPDAGALTLGGVAVATGQTIAVGDIPSLTYTPAENQTGQNYAGFTFQVQDDGGTANGGIDTDQSPNTITFNVGAVDDAPVPTAGAITVTEGQTAPVDTNVITIADPDTNPAQITISPTGVAGGQFQVGGNPAPTFTYQDVLDGAVTFVHDGSETPADFDFQVTDGTSTVPVDPTVNFLPVNDAPQGADNTVNAPEDGSYSFAAGDFGFSDPAEGHAFEAVTITTVPGAGALTLDGNPVAPGQSIAVAQIPNLVFTPAPEANGSGYANFTFQVQDDGGTANGGQDLDPTPNTITIDVSPENDAPTVDLNGGDGQGDDYATAFTEDGPAVAIADTDVAVNDVDDANLASATITLADGKAGDILGLSGPLPGGITFATSSSAPLAGEGTITVTLTGPASQADFAAALELVTFENTSDNPNTADRTLQVVANDGTNDSSPVTTTVSVLPVNDAPEGTDKAIGLSEDGSHAFSAADFGFSDPAEGDAFQAVTITTLPTEGSLTLGGVAVTAGQSIAVGDIPSLTYSPAPGANGDAYANFTFQVQDDGGTANGGIDTDQSPNTITFNVGAVNDAPVPTAGAITVTEGESAPVDTSVISIADPDSTPGQITITPTGVAGGQFEVSGNPAPSFTYQDVLDGNVTFVHDGSETPADFDFQVTDGGETVNADPAITFVPVNDAPEGADKAIGVQEDGSHAFSADDFGFSDPAEGDAFQAVTITTLPTEGSLTLGGLAVTAGQSIAVGDIPSLTYSPAPGANGDAYANFTFQVQDDGGTANGGVDTDQSPNTITFNVGAVNDAPVPTAGAITVTEGETAPVDTSVISIADPDNTPSQITITPTGVAGGQFEVGGNPAPSFTYQDVLDGNVTFVHDGSEMPADFDFQVTDGGETVNADPAITFVPVNDAPEGTDSTLSITEDGSHAFSADDFGFSDPAEGDAFQAVTITTLPTAGSLTLGGVAVTAGQSIAVNDIPNLSFAPAPDATGDGYASLTFQVQDDGGTANGGVDLDQSPNTLTFDVTPENDVPEVDLNGPGNPGDGYATTFTEDGPAVAIADPTTTVSDADDPNLASATITLTDGKAGDILGLSGPLPGGITFSTSAATPLEGDGTITVTLGGPASQADFAAALEMVTFENTSDNPDTADRTLQVVANDGTNDSSPVTTTVSVVPVNDAPEGTDKAIGLSEDGSHSFSAADFGFSDPAEGDAFQAVTITTLPTAGSLTLGGVAVAAGQSIAVGDISSLTYSPEPGANGDAYANFTFQVQDDGGTANGGIDTDQSPNTITFNIGAVNDAPVPTAGAITVTEGGTAPVDTSVISIADPDNTPGEITITPTGVAGGEFQVGGNSAPSFTYQDLLDGNATFVHDGSETPADFDFQVTDGGETVNADPAITFLPVNDAPEGADKAIGVQEDGSHAFSAADFGFSDPAEGDAFQAVTITTLPTAGSLALGGVTVAAGQSIAVGDIPTLTYSPAPGASGESYANFTFQVQDDGGTANGGIDTDQSPNAITFNVSPVNDAPSGTDNTIGLTEDGSHGFNAADFGFSDPDGDAFQAVTISTLPTAGALTLNGVNVSAGQSIGVGDIPNLVFTPAPGAEGNNYADFTFQVQDDGGTANGGVDTDQTPNTITFNVAAVNDAPVPTVGGLTIYEGGTATIDTSVITIADSDNTPGQISITPTGVVAGQFVDGSNSPVSEFTYQDVLDGAITFVHDGSETPVTFDFSISDGGETVTADPSIEYVPVNDEPEGTDNTIAVEEDGAHTFAAADFGFSDPVEGDAFQAVTITTLPTDGVLTLGGSAVGAGQSVAVGDIPNLVFTPAPDAAGESYASFTFQVQDDGGTVHGGIDTDQTLNTITFDVTPENDAPTVELSDNTAAFTEGGPTVAITDEAAVADIDDPNLAHATVTLLNGKVGDVLGHSAPLPGGITFTTSATTPIDADGTITVTLTGPATQVEFAQALALITFENTSDNPDTTDRTLQVVANDGKVDSAPATTTVSVTPVNDAPEGTDKTVSLDEDTSYAFDAADFGFSDPAEGDNFQAVKITTLPDAGALTLNGAAIASGQMVDVADLPNLVFAPAPDANGEAYASFTFQVQDDGGTANGGVDLDQSPNTITFNVNPVNDAPDPNPDGGGVGVYDDHDSISEGDEPIFGNVLANDSDPDGDDLTVAAVNAEQSAVGTTVAGTYGSVTISADGNYVYSLNNNAPEVQQLQEGQAVTDTFTYLASDGNGGTAPASLNITIHGTNNAPTISSSITDGTVYEAGLAEGTGQGPTTTSVSGTFTVSDPDSQAISLMVNGTALGALNGDAGTVLGAIPGEDGSGTLTIYGDGSWTYQLNTNVAHDGDDSTFNAADLEQFQVVATDGGANSQPLAMTFNIVDDTISVTPPSDATITNTASATYVGTLDTLGADNDTYSASLTATIGNWSPSATFAATDMTSGGNTVYYHVDPSNTSVLVAYTDVSGSPTGYSATNSDQSLVFTLNLEPNSDQFQMQMHAPIDVFQGYVFDFSDLSASGPQDNYRFTSGGSLLSPGDALPAGETVIFTAHGLAAGELVNANANYMGLNNNLIESDESGIAIDVEQTAVSIGITMEFVGSGTDKAINWVAYDATDTNVIASGTFDNGTLKHGTMWVDFEGNDIGKVEISPATAGTNSFRIGTIQIIPEESMGTVDLNFNAEITDSDGDSQLTSIGVLLQSGEAPVVLDMNDDGATFDTIEEGIEFDIDGDGQSEQVAWADESDAVLVYDYNNDGQVTERGEVVFTDYVEGAETDLEGLRAFDTDQDMMLSSGDEEFASFGVWQDADGNGVVGEGELQSLSEAGIESISLVSDGQSYAAAGGDVVVHGEATVNYADGTTGTAADATFAYEETGIVEPAGSEAPLEVATAEGESVNLDAPAEAAANESQIAGPDAAADAQATETPAVEPVEVEPVDVAPIEELEAAPPPAPPADDASASAAAAAM